MPEFRRAKRRVRQRQPRLISRMLDLPPGPEHRSQARMGPEDCGDLGRWDFSPVDDKLEEKLLLGFVEPMALRERVQTTKLKPCLHSFLGEYSRAAAMTLAQKLWLFDDCNIHLSATVA
jgi:hypothetical protein